MISFDWLTGFLAAIVTLMVAAQSMAATEPTQYSASRPLSVEALRKGGFVIFVRHAHADVGSDATPFDLVDCARQRNLSEMGKAQSAAIGRGFSELRIPVGAVRSSEFCRALDTARLAFGRVEPTPTLNLCCLDGRNLTDADRLDYLQRALATRPAPGTNTVLVGHASHMMADLQMGEAAIYAPDGAGSYTRISRVLPEEWLNGVYRTAGSADLPSPLVPGR